MPYMLVMMVVLVISWAMMLNIAKLLSDRMIMQNAADNAALSAAVSKARLLNQLGQLNYLMACALYGTEYGVSNYTSGGLTGGVYGICMQGVGIADYKCVSDTQSRIGSVVDASHGGCSGTDEGPHETFRTISAIRNLVNGMIKTQDALVFQFRSDFALPVPSFNRISKIANAQMINSDSRNTIVDHIYVLNPGSVLLNDLVRNENGVEFCKTKSFCVSVPPNAITPPGAHGHIYWTDDYMFQKKSWLYWDKSCFNDNMKITVVAVRNSNSDSNIGFPLLGKWLNIEWPTITVTASAGIYNREGAMFTVEEKGRPSDEILPVIRAYKNAQKGGWDAHLVPVNKLKIQH